jgi:hypothetical protein
VVFEKIAAKAAECGSKIFGATNPAEQFHQAGASTLALQLLTIGI